MRHTAPLLLTAALALTGPVAAQECHPADDSNEAEVFAIYSVPLAFSQAGTTGRLASGAVRVGLEVSAIPHIDDDISTPLTCRPGKGPENTNLLPVLPRPRVSIGLPEDFTLEASWVPPIRINGVKANLFGVALSRGFALGEAYTMLLRGHATFGTIHAPVTCDEDALEDPASECFGGELSDDAYNPNIFGAEVSVARSGSPRFQPYLGAGYNVLHPRFQVNFTNSAGDRDTTRVSVNLDRAVVFGGLTWFPSPRTGVSAEFYVSPKDAITARLTFRQAVTGL